MKKNNTDSMFSKYSDTPTRKEKNTKSSQQLMTSYEQRFKAPTSLSKDLTAPKRVQTLNEKIEARNEKIEIQSDAYSDRVSVEIAGHKYLLGSSDKLSESRIRRIASLVNRILSDTKESNAGLTNSKITTLALLEACDRIVSLQDENSNMKTELMYLQQKIAAEEHHRKPKEPTPMEILADEFSNTESEG